MTDSSKFDSIRPFLDSEVPEALKTIANDPMFLAILNFSFPDLDKADLLKKLDTIQSIQDFQAQIIYYSLKRVLKESCSHGITHSGFDKLEKNTSYLFISNHRDIILDTSFLNYILFENDLVMTASAIGDNLVKKPVLSTLSRLNRNFIVRRGLSPRELLQSSTLMSEYMYQLLTKENRSVWIAQREGRTKDGIDVTQQGVLKMLSIADENKDLIAFFKSLRIVPVSISYQYDPTDSLKIPELLANLKNEKYIKSENEDFNTLYRGIMGQKKSIHFHAGDILSTELDALAETTNVNQQVKILAQIIDNQIIKNYKLWSTNYIALDLLHGTKNYDRYYTTLEQTDFEERMEQRIDKNDPLSVERFLSMYANPVLNKMNLVS